MNRKENSDFEELQELLWRAEAVLQDSEDEPEEELFPEDTYEEEAEVDYSEYLPLQSDDSGMYRNFANEYGTSPKPRPYYTPEPEDEEDMEEEDEGPIYRDPVQRVPEPQKRTRRRRRRGCGCGCLTWLLVFIAAIAASVFLFIRPPQSQDSIGDRKRDSASILICGTDKDGTRTDTMMLLYLSGSEKQASLLSLPRDSYTITSSGNAAKLNSCFGRNGTGVEGMEALLDYVKDIIGYRPDGYILVDFKLVPKIVDLMGGVEVEVPMDMTVDGVSLEEGLQHLNGKQTLALLRFRKGYAMADLTRIEVQRSVIQACIEQWITPANISGANDAINLIEENSLSSLTTGNYLWVAKTLLGSMKNIQNNTLPGYPDYRGGVSYYILNKNEIAALVNESYNPYDVTIDPSDLNIAG